jgi:hypothetical protein
MTMRERQSWQAFTLSFGFLVAMLAAVFFGRTGLFVVPLSVNVTPEGTILVRQVPFGAVDVDWIMEVTTPDGRKCPKASGRAIIQPKADDTARLPLPPEVVPCAVVGAVAETSYRMDLFGILLTPVRWVAIVTSGASE